MSVFRRIIYHSGWFILFGPIIGVVTALCILTYFPAILNRTLLSYVYAKAPDLIIFFGWIYSLVPAWLTGITCALFPLPLYNKTIKRILLCTLAGILITILFNLLRYNFNVGQLLYGESLIMLISASVAGVIMGGVIAYLPGLRRVTCNNQLER